MTNYNSPPRTKQVSYGEYEAERLHMIEKKLMQHYGKNFSQLHKDAMRKEYQLLSV